MQRVPALTATGLHDQVVLQMSVTAGGHSRTSEALMGAYLSAPNTEMVAFTAIK